MYKMIDLRRERCIQKPTQQRSVVNIFVLTIFVLQVVTALLSAHAMASQWSELTVTWPYEITFCMCELMVVLLVKISQLYMVNIFSRVKKVRYLWLTILLALPCILLLCCGLAASRLAKVRMYNKLVWHMNQQGAIGSSHNDSLRNGTVPYLDTYQIISMSNYDTKAYVKAAWDIVQQKYQCCGSNTAHDWSLVRIVPPKSCCIDPELPCVFETAFRAGCALKVNEILSGQIRDMEVTIFISMSFEFLMIVFVFFTIIGKNMLGYKKRAKVISIKRTPKQILKDNEYFYPISVISKPAENNLIISNMRLV